jgi:hypothetical protein
LDFVMRYRIFRVAFCLFFVSALSVGCGGRENRVLQADVSELEAFEEQQKKDQDADLEAMKKAGPNAAP